MSKVGRNDPCPCGSGRKYKQCCLRNDGIVTGPTTAPSLQLDRVAARYNRAVSLQLEGALDDAIRAYRAVLADAPEHVDARYNLAIALAAQGKVDEAIASYRGVLERRPALAEARSNLGLLLHRQGKLDEAIDCYRAALGVKPHAWTYNNLGNALEEAGQIDAAVASHRQALELVDALEIRINFARCAKHLDASCVDAGLRALLARAIDEAWTRPNDLAGAAIKLLRADPVIGACIERASRAWPNRLPTWELWGPAERAAICNDAMLLSLLHNAPVCDIAMERFVTAARGAMLDAAYESEAERDVDARTVAFRCAIARQCHLNEYVFDCSDEEAARAKALQGKITDALASGSAIPAPLLIAAAAYAPLSALAVADKLLERSWPPSVQAMLVEQIVAPETEERARDGLDRLTAIDDAVSLRVQRQYEENPYPRWTRVPLASKAQPLNAYLRAQFPSGSFEALAEDRAVDVLIAGCGTGQEAIETARQIAGARVLAIDLSLASLAYAKRKSAEAGIGNIRYAQADILNLPTTGGTFDVIASVGVLHHLADPIAGWRALLPLLRPGGFMRVGFYSDRARRDVVAARTFIASRGFGSTAADIRRARHDLMGDSSGRFAALALLRDFYTTSECRDLLFHVEEHRFTLPGIKEALGAIGLRFIGLLLEPQVVRAYRTRFPADRALTDLDNWDAFESEFPNTFTGMYRFWVQKPR